jgi:cysteine desulfurase
MCARTEQRPMRIYLDHNATSPLRPVARAAMIAALERCGNASSIHAEGREARSLVESARETIARQLGVIAPMVVFTSSGSEANNLAIKGAPVERLIVGATEHPSVIEAAKARGKPVELARVDSNGVIDLANLATLLANGSHALVSVMLANNETGAINPIADIVALARKHNALAHCDAVQAFGKIPVNFGLLGVDLLSVSAHKLGGPLGAGALVIRDGLAMTPLISGGGQELRRRAGTENIAAIAGFAAAAAEKTKDVRVLRDRLESELEGTIIVSKDVARLSNTSCFAFPGLSAETALMALDLDGIAVSSGSACSSGKVAKSHVLAAMGIAPKISTGAIRVSLGWNTTEDDIARFITSWRKLTARHRAKVAA